MQFLKFLIIAATLLLAPAAYAFPWVMFVPATTACDSYPLPSCRARTLCENDGQYWYNGRCNTSKHPDQTVLEKLDGSWEITFFYISSCYGWRVETPGPRFTLSRDMIADDNSQVVQFEGKVFSIASPVFWRPQTDLDQSRGPFYQYAILARQRSTYLLKDINSTWEDEATCQPVHGDPKEEYRIKAGDTGLYSFDLTADNQLEGRAFFMNADVWFDMAGRKIP